MTPYEFARWECANFVSGECIWTKDGICLLARKPLKPCRYFERCVLNLPDQPGADKMPHYFDYLDARNRYLEATIQPIKNIKVRDCPSCGEPLRKRERMCRKCALKKRRKSERERKRRKRSG